MRSISHRELRNESADVLRRVAAGETIVVTNRGRAAAVIGPVGASVLDELAERGQVRRATTDAAALASIRRGRSERTTSDLLAEVRGER